MMFIIGSSTSSLVVVTARGSMASLLPSLTSHASIIQGSAIGPASYVVNAADLTTVTAGSLVFKYADDTYRVVQKTDPLINLFL